MSSTTVIRLASEADAAAIQAIYAPYVQETPISFEVEPPTVEEMRLRIVNTLQQCPWLVAERDGEVLGYVYASAHRARAAYVWSVDAAVYLDLNYRKMGLGTALYTSLFRLLALQGFYNAYAGITLPNIASVRLHESMGFRLVGVYESVGFKAGVWYDVGWWQMALQEHAADPALPLSLATAREQAGWEAALNAGLPLLRI